MSSSSRKDSLLWHTADLAESLAHSLDEAEGALVDWVNLERDADIIRPLLESVEDLDQMCEIVRNILWELGGGAIGPGIQSVPRKYNYGRRDKDQAWSRLITLRKPASQVIVQLSPEVLHEPWVATVTSLRRLVVSKPEWEALAEQCKKGGLIEIYNTLTSAIYQMKRIETHLTQMHDWWL